MDGGQHDEFLQERPARPPVPTEQRARRRVRVEAGGNGTVRAVSDGARARAFHYASERTMMLGQIADRLPSATRFTLSANARRLPVIATRLTSLAGNSVHVAPCLTEGALYLDHRDLVALEGGAIVPDLAEVIAAIR